MISRATRTLIALVCALFIAISASAAPEGRSESRDWLARSINKIVQQLKKVLAPSPADDPILIPPNP